MKPTKKLFSLLIICALFSNVAKSQDLYLKITGKDSLETEKIDSLTYIKNHPSFKSLSSEVDSVYRQLQKLGYVDLQTSPLKKENDSLFTSTFSLGPHYRYLKIYYEEQLPVSEKTLQALATDTGTNYFVIPFTKVETVLSFLNQETAKQGQAFSAVRLGQFRKGKNATLIATLRLTASKARKIDKIIVKGYEKFPISFLKHFIGIKTGQVFDKTTVEEKLERLKNLPFAGSIKPSEVQFTRDSTTLYLYLQKEKSNSFDGFLGFSNDEEDSKIQLTGYVNLHLLNNLNYGESLNIEYRSDGGEQINFKADADLPYLFQTPIGLKAGLEIFKKDSSYVTVDQNFKLTYRFTPKIDGYIGYQGIKSNSLLEENFSGIFIEDYSADYLHVGGNYMDYSKMNELFPIKASLGIDLGYGTRHRETAKNTQFLGNVRTEYIFQLNLRNSIYLHNESAYLSSEDPLTNELFRFGGINSLRGFSENSIFASLFSVTQSEYRYLLSSNLYVHSIIDYAYYENIPLDLRENLYGIGFGLGMKTDAGILKVNFANGKSDGQNFKFSNTKIHLSFTTKF